MTKNRTNSSALLSQYETTKIVEFGANKLFLPIFRNTYLLTYCSPNDIEGEIVILRKTAASQCWFLSCLFFFKLFDKNPIANHSLRL